MNYSSKGVTTMIMKCIPIYSIDQGKTSGASCYRKYCISYMRERANETSNETRVSNDTGNTFGEKIALPSK